jgi:hypothetical protein
MSDLIPQDQIKNATLFSSRYDFIKTLPKKISYLEAGVLAGDFSLKVIETVNPKISYLVEPFFEVDLHAPEYGGPRWEKAEDHYSFILNRFKNIKNVRIYKRTFEDFFKENKQDKIDFIYMDYSTDYPSVQKQLLMGAEILSDDGVLGFNDYNIYFNDTVTGEKIGVVPAINDFLRNNSNWYVHAFALNDNLTSDIYLKKLQ